MSNETPKPWTVLYGSDDDSNAIVVPEGTSTTHALCELVAAVHGVDTDEHNPVIAREAERLKVETWRSCTKAWREAEGIYEFDSYWAPHGDGSRTIQVVHFDGDVYGIGDEIERLGDSEDEQ